MSADIPTLPAYRTPLGGQLAVWCEHERLWHLHGSVGPNPGDGNGHRCGHCKCPNSPYASTGYFLEEAGRFTRSVRTGRPDRVWRGGCANPACGGKGRKR